MYEILMNHVIYKIYKKIKVLKKKKEIYLLKKSIIFKYYNNLSSNSLKYIK